MKQENRDWIFYLSGFFIGLIIGFVITIYFIFK